MKTQQIEKSLKVCKTVAGILKEQFPNDINDIRDGSYWYSGVCTEL